MSRLATDALSGRFDFLDSDVVVDFQVNTAKYSEIDGGLIKPFHFIGGGYDG